MNHTDTISWLTGSVQRSLFPMPRARHKGMAGDPFIDATALDFSWSSTTTPGDTNDAFAVDFWLGDYNKKQVIKLLCLDCPFRGITLRRRDNLAGVIPGVEM